MAEKAFEAEDPMSLNGTILRLKSAGEAARINSEMAECFIEEYLLLGYSELELLHLFKNPFYRATYALYRERGESYVRDLIRKVAEGERHG